MVKYSCKGIDRSFLFKFLKVCVHVGHGFIDILNHEDEPVIIRIKSLRTAEYKLDPDIYTFKILHLDIKRRVLSGCKVFFEILRICPSKKLLLVLGPDHIDYHQPPVCIEDMGMHGFIGYF